jgi:hypothetical protein
VKQVQMMMTMNNAKENENGGENECKKKVKREQ